MGVWMRSVFIEWVEGQVGRGGGTMRGGRRETHRKEEGLSRRKAASLARHAWALLGSIFVLCVALVDVETVIGAKTWVRSPVFAVWDVEAAKCDAGIRVGRAKRALDRGSSVSSLAWAGLWFSIELIGLGADALSGCVMEADWPLMVMHHAVTIALVVLCSTIGMETHGVWVLFLHALADPFLEAALVARKKGCGTACQVFFTAFLVVWMVTRAVLFPLFVFGGNVLSFVAVYEGIPSLGLGLDDFATDVYATHIHGCLASGYANMYAYTALGLLSLLVLANYIWTWAVLRVARHFLAGSSAYDPRSEPKPTS